MSRAIRLRWEVVDELERMGEARLSTSSVLLITSRKCLVIEMENRKNDVHDRG